MTDAENPIQAEGTPPEAAAVAAPAPEQQPPSEQTPAPAALSLTAPEGTLDSGTLATFTEAATKLGLSQEVAQGVIDTMAPALQEQAKRVQDARVAEAKTVWADQTAKDKDLGGDKLPETLALAKKVYDLGSPELQQLLETTALGSHPELVRWAATIGRKLSPDSFVPATGTPEPAPKTLAERMFPNHGQQTKE